MSVNDNDNLILFPSAKNFEVRIDEELNDKMQKEHFHADIEVDDSLICEIEDSISALDVKNIDKLTTDITNFDILRDHFEFVNEGVSESEADPPSSIFFGDFQQLDFEIDLLSGEELMGLITKQQTVLAEHQMRLKFFIDEIDDTFS